MKKPGILSLSSIIMWVIVSCMEKPVVNSPADLVDVHLSVSDVFSVTRKTTIGEESLINRWCLYLCRDGKVYHTVSASSSAGVIVKLPQDTYTVHAFVNFEPSDLGVYPGDSEDVILNFKTDLQHLRHTDMYMYGGDRITVSGESSYAIRVKRLFARVKLDKVSVDFSEVPALADRTFTLDKAYLINLSGNVGIMEPYSIGCWYNKRGLDVDPLKADGSTEISDMVCNSINVPIASGSSHNQSYYFYCFPNPTVSDSRSIEWGARKTRLVLECSVNPAIGGRSVFYYPINIADSSGILEANKLYTISEVLIKNIGSDSPDTETWGAVNVNFSVSAPGWDDTYTVGETI